MKLEVTLLTLWLLLAIFLGSVGAASGASPSRRNRRVSDTAPRKTATSRKSSGGHSSSRRRANTYEDDDEEGEDADEDYFPPAPRRGGDRRRAAERPRQFERYDDEDDEDDYYPPPSRSNDRRRAPEKSSQSMRPRSDRRPPPARAPSHSAGRGPSASSRASSGSRRPARPSSDRQVVAWGAAQDRDRRARQQPSLREKAMDSIQAAREQSQSQFRLFYRMGKSLFSSSYEKLFLQATAPDDEPVSQDHVERLLESIAQFRTLGDTEEEDNPYRVTLRKLWSKMIEKDWRTVVKALFLMHRIIRDAHPRDGAIFDRHLRRMQREINPKAKPPRTFFNLAQIIDLAAESEEYRNFVGAYAIFTLKRATTFTGRFEQVRSLGSSHKSSEVMSVMRAARAILHYGLQCTLEADLENYVTCTALELLARDMRDLWKGYCKGVNCLMQDKKAPTPAVKKEKLKILESFKDDRANVKQFMRKTSRALEYYRLRVPADLETKVDMEALATSITALKRGKTAAHEPEDDYDDEEDARDAYDDDEDEYIEEEEEEESFDEDDETDEDEDDEDGVEGAVEEDEGDYDERESYADDAEEASFEAEEDERDDDLVDDMDDDEEEGEEEDEEDEDLAVEKGARRGKKKAAREEVFEDDEDDFSDDELWDDFDDDEDAYDDDDGDEDDY